MTITDEQLSAFLDGELPAEDLKRIAAAIDADAALRKRAEALAAPDTLIKKAYSAIDDAPMPAAVTALLAEPAADNVVASAPRTASPARWTMPLAASIALSAGIALGMFMSSPARMTPTGAQLAGAINPGDPLHAALDATPSGESVALPGARTASFVLSFKSHDGDYCREFIVDGETDSSRALACREDGRWSVKLAAVEAKGDGGYATAASGVSAAFDAGAEALGAGDPLDRAREDALLQSGWSGE